MSIDSANGMASKAKSQSSRVGRWFGVGLTLLGSYGSSGAFILAIEFYSLHMHSDVGSELILDMNGSRLGEGGVAPVQFVPFTRKRITSRVNTTLST